MIARWPVKNVQAFDEATAESLYISTVLYRTCGIAVLDQMFVRFIFQSLAASLFVRSTFGTSTGNSTEGEYSRGVETCKTLQSAFGPNVVALSGSKYDAGVSRARNLFNTEAYPACVVFPIDASHVQTAMKAIYQNKIRYAVQAGGHSAMQGWNTYVTHKFLNIYFSLQI